MPRTIEEVELENHKLRWLLAKGTDPCIYCGLPKADMMKCESGFPGCGRGDDLMIGGLLNEDIAFNIDSTDTSRGVSIPISDELLRKDSGKRRS